MRAFFDTSVLLPIFLGEHIHHKASVECVAWHDRLNGCCAAHTLVELYSSFTRLPRPLRKTPEEAMLFVENVSERLTTITLTSEEHVATLRKIANLGITGGTVYDALLAHCAVKSGAETIYTWNMKHYAQCGPEVTRRLSTP